MSEVLRHAVKLALNALSRSGEEPGTKQWEIEGEAINALRAALAEPEQSEPVATLWQHSETGRTRVVMEGYGYITDCDARWFKAADLFAHPPRREPLTLAEILKATPYGIQHITDGVLVRFARAIEQAHGIIGEKT